MSLPMLPYKEERCTRRCCTRITLAFGVKEQSLDTPVFIEWCGTDAGWMLLCCVVNYRQHCSLPIELLTTPLKTPITWDAQGYTDFGKAKRPGGKR